MPKQIKISLMVTLQYTPDPKDYKPGDAIEDMMNEDLESFENEIDLFVNYSGSNIEWKGEIVEVDDATRE